MNRLRDGAGRRTITFLVGLGVVLALSTRLQGDLDVGIPPGTPLEWLQELPFHEFDVRRGPIYTAGGPSSDEKPEKSDEDVHKGTTVVVKPKTSAQKPAPPLPRFGAFNPMGAARIITYDITTELAWTSWTRADIAPSELAYPPVTRADLHWLTLSAFLRAMMHPARISLSETYQYLISLGPAIYDTLDNSAQGLNKNKKLLEYLESNVPPLPRSAPDTTSLIRDVKNPEQAMLVEWAARELVADHLHAYNPLFARRILSLGGEALPALWVCARSDHSLLRENAAGLLASFDSYDEENRKVLLELLGGKDSVARNRVLEGLLRYGDVEVEEFLVKALRSRDRHFASYAIRSLGLMRSVRARKPLQAILKRVQKDSGEAWLAAASALGRIGGDTDGSSVAVLQSCVKKIGRSSAAFDAPRPALTSDRPDRSGDRARVLLQAVVVALARLGDETSRTWIGGWLDAPVGDVDPLRPGEKAPGFNQLQTRISDPVMGNIEPYCQLQAIEALAEMADAGREYLKKILTGSKDLRLRAYALEFLDRGEEDVELVTQIAATRYPSVLRVQAMEALARRESTREKAIEIAQKMVEEYLSAAAKGPSALRKGQVILSFECLSAVELLGEHRPLPVETLLALLDASEKVGDYEHFAGEGGDAKPGKGFNQKSVSAFPPLHEAIVVEIGRHGDIAGFDALRRIVEADLSPGRVEATVALGYFPIQESCELLTESLRDHEPWVRYAAYRALRRISSPRENEKNFPGTAIDTSGLGYFANWLFGESKDSIGTIDSWQSWRRDEGAKLATEAELIAEKKRRVEEAKREEERKKKAEREKKSGEKEGKKKVFKAETPL